MGLINEILQMEGLNTLQRRLLAAKAVEFYLDLMSEIYKRNQETFRNFPAVKRSAELLRKQFRNG